MTQANRGMKPNDKFALLARRRHWKILCHNPWFSCLLALVSFNFRFQVSSVNLWLRHAAALCIVLLLTAAAQASDLEPFSVSASLVKTEDGRTELTASFAIPPGHHLYADRIQVQAGSNGELVPKDIPAPKEHLDESSGQTDKIYDHDVALVYTVSNANESEPLALRVRYQGCSGSICFLPVTTNFVLKLGGAGETNAGQPAVRQNAAEAEPGVSHDAPPAQWQGLAARFTVRAKEEGYLRPAMFVKFLDRAESMQPEDDARGKRSLWLSALLFILWGLGLNLTPCVLPMIPVNLAIIGVGARGVSRGKGLILGTFYGLGMALAYGSLGIIVILSGAMFGSISASPWFNLSIAVLFAALALSMFGAFPIDFSRFQAGFSAESLWKSKYLIAVSMGAVAAILAGACVAPALIAVLTLSLDLYSKGNPAGLLLPFLLGVGMALPWPLAGAGLAVLPKPGKWMDFVKYAFGVIILLVAIYYGKTAYEGFHWRYHVAAAAGTNQIDETDTESWTPSLAEGLAKALAEKKPVLIDFWASWCKNCKAMDATTFKDPHVKKRLEQYVGIKCRMEDPDEPDAREIREYFGFWGLPAYVVLAPEEWRW